MEAQERLERPPQMPAEGDFEQVVCWRDEAVRRILDIEALRMSDEMFLATHYPTPMRRMDVVGRDTGRSYDQEQLLRDFLDPNEPFRFVPVLGATGVGKSHLVRWLDIQVRRHTPPEVNRRVFLIKKAGASLRDILRRILNIKEAEGERFDDYREQLATAGEAATDDERKERLLSELALAVQNYDPTEVVDDLGALPKQERRRLQTEQHVAEELPTLLRDEFFRAHWLAGDGVIERIHRKAFARSDRRDRPEFEKEDLPLDYSPAEINREAPQAVRIFTNLQRGAVQRAAVRVLNECLGRAIRYVLNFSASDLFDLMKEVRRELARQGVELVLFIEDIAAVQGLDRQLLAAIVESDPDLGAIRTAMGCTKGHYDGRLQDTVRDRASFRVNLNVEGGRAGIDVPAFAARYLNAVRLGEQQLGRAGEPDDAPSLCAACPFEDRCHEAFGAREGYGLYPFNEEALRDMYASVSPDEFNPRRLINQVLRHVLVEHTRDVESGSFPSEVLRRHFRGAQGSDVDPTTLQAWRRGDPDHVQQRETLADLWSQTRDGGDLPGAVFQAFGIPVDDAASRPDEETKPPVNEPVAGDEPVEDSEEAGPGEEEETGETREPPRPDPERERLRKREKALSDWRGGANLSQAMVDELRSLVRRAVARRIEWDVEGLSESFFSGTTEGAFREISIDFNGQDLQQDMAPRPTRVKLELPLKGQDPVDVEIALRAMLRRRHYGDWRFANGRTDLRTFARCVDRWAEVVLDQLRRPTRSAPPWNPARAAAELLAVRARFGGAPMDEGVPVDERVDALFRDYDAISEERGEAWTKVVEQLDESCEDLVGILEAHAWLRKGSRARTRIYDLAQFSGVLGSLGPDGALRAPFHADSRDELRKEYRPLWRPRQVVESFLQRAVDDELKQRRAWVEQIRDAFGEAGAIRAHVPQIDGALLQARDEANRVLFSANKHEQHRCLSKHLRAEGVQETAQATAQLLKRHDEGASLGAVLSQLGRECTADLKAVVRYIVLSEELLGATHEGLQSDIRTLRGDGEGGGTGAAQQIGEDLQNLSEALRDLAR